MKRGHVTGTKRERTPRQATIDRYTKMGEAIAKTFAGKTAAEMLDMVRSQRK